MSPGMLAYPTQSEIASAAHFVPTYSETVSRLGHTRSCPFSLHTLAVLERTPTPVCGWSNESQEPANLSLGVGE